MEDLTVYMSIVQFIIMLGAAIFAVFFYFSKPDQRASKRLDKIETKCPMKHKSLDEAIFTITTAINFIKENHLRHIEADVNKINEKIARMDGQNEMIIGLLKESLSKK